MSTGKVGSLLCNEMEERPDGGALLALPCTVIELKREQPTWPLERGGTEGRAVGVDLAVEGGNETGTSHRSRWGSRRRSCSMIFLAQRLDGMEEAVVEGVAS